MREFRIVITGHPYSEPRYYGDIKWRATDVYVRHPHGGKDSRHSDGRTFLSSTDTDRIVETRIPVSAVTDELLTTIALPTSLTEPKPLRGAIRDSDLVINTASVGTAPRLAVTMVHNLQLPNVLVALSNRSGVSSVQTYRDKEFDQSLVVSLLRSPDPAL